MDGVAENIPGLALDGASEWMAVPWDIPNTQEDTSKSLACLLLCKGVAKFQVNKLFSV